MADMGVTTLHFTPWLQPWIVYAPEWLIVIWFTSMALVSILVSLNGIFSGNFSLIMATSKQSPKSMWSTRPVNRSNIKLDGCLQQNIVQFNVQTHVHVIKVRCVIVLSTCLLSLECIPPWTWQPMSEYNWYVGQTRPKQKKQHMNPRIQHNLQLKGNKNCA